MGKEHTELGRARPPGDGRAAKPQWPGGALPLVALGIVKNRLLRCHCWDPVGDKGVLHVVWVCSTLRERKAEIYHENIDTNVQQETKREIELDAKGGYREPIPTVGGAKMRRGFKPQRGEPKALVGGPDRFAFGMAHGEDGTAMGTKLLGVA